MSLKRKVYAREAGPHIVKDIRRTGDRCLVICQRCGAKWPEGYYYPEVCEK